MVGIGKPIPQDRRRLAHIGRRVTLAEGLECGEFISAGPGQQGPHEVVLGSEQEQQDSGAGSDRLRQGRRVKSPMPCWRT